MARLSPGLEWAGDLLVGGALLTILFEDQVALQLVLGLSGVALFTIGRVFAPPMQERARG
jgi:hypothetical protein